MKLPEISIEQQNIIQQLLLNNNVVADSVAGSGKTTCNLYMAQHFYNINILLLTYNSKLKLETREKAKKMGISNIEVHSYHSFCVKHYDDQCFTDSIIKQIIIKKNNPSKQFNFGLIVLDEAQDITSLYYELICKIYKDNKNANPKICIFGDKNQCIFDFNKADQRFIEYANQLFNFNSDNWVGCNLSVSFRITHEMALFINKCLLKKERIISNKITNNKPRYIICDCFGDRTGTSSRTFEEIKYYFGLGYKPSDIFILAPSVKSQNSPVRQLENKIKREMPDVMVYVPTNDDTILDEELLKGKITFSTFHQTKGLERKVVIIFNFDNSYFEYYKKDANPYICPNELYVATTRGIEQLTLFHHYNNEYLHFIDEANIQLYCHFENTRMYIQSSEKPNKNINTSITDSIKFLPQNIIDECFNQLEITQNSNIINKINIPLKISNDETTEGVSEITGIAIPSMFELRLKNKMEIFENLLINNFEKMVIKNGNNGCLIQLHNEPKHKKYNINNIILQNLTSEELLYISNCWNTHKTGFLFKIYQISNYGWLEQTKLDECINRLTKLKISINSSFEYRIITENEIELLNRKLIGFIDCIDTENNIVYEFKCVQKLEKEHYLQLALYMYMYELEKIKHIKNITDEFNKNKDKLIKSSIVDLLHNKERINEIMFINEKKLVDYKNNIIYEETTQYSVGDIIKYKLFNEETGTIVKIYKTNRNIKVKNSDNKNIDIPKTLILSVKKHLNIDYINAEINNIENVLCKLNNELIDTNKLIDETIQQELLKITTELENKIKIYKNKTEYILFNILTNEYINIKCEFEKLKKMVEYLIYSKYINDKPITDDEFINKNENIRKQYFS